MADFYNDQNLYYPASEKLTVFPCAWRDHGIDPEARLNSEKSLSNIGGQGGGYKNYISIANDTLSNTTITIVLNGYTFTLAGIDFSELTSILDEQNPALYVGIKLEDYKVTSTKNSTKLGSFYSVATGESENTTNQVLDVDIGSGGTKYFTGLCFSKNKIIGTGTSCIKIYESDKFVNRNILPTSITNGKNTGSLVLNSISNFDDEIEQDETNIATGLYSIASGFGTNASGNYSIATGKSTAATSNYSHAEGYKTTADSIAAHTEGQFTVAHGNAAHAEGGVAEAGHGETQLYTSADGDYSHAEGYATTASGTGSHAEGNNTTASSSASHAEGDYTEASGTDFVTSGGDYYARHAEGILTKATKAGSHTEGVKTIASGTASHAEGSATIAYGANSHAEGYGYTYELTLNGGGSENPVYNYYSDYTDLIKIGSIIKYNNVLAKVIAIDEEQGQFTLDKVLDESILSDAEAEIYYGIAYGIDSHAECEENTASGNASHAEGFYTTASGSCAHAEGHTTVASGINSHAEGWCTTANGSYSHTEGWLTFATANSAHAEGRETAARKEASHAEGYGTVADGAYQHVFGKWNVLDTSSVEIVGWGNDGTTSGRKNIRRLDANGNENIRGKLYIGDTSNALSGSGTHQLEVNGSAGFASNININSTNYMLTSNTYANASTALRVKGSTWLLDNWDSSERIGLVIGTSKNFYVMGNGAVTAKQYTATSDKRLKENIIKFKPEKSILDLPVYKYNFIGESKEQIGCLAQDLQEICPEIVEENANGYLAIQESKIVYLLLDEVKKLKEEIKELKNDIRK